MDKDSQLIEESFKRIESKEGIIGTIVVNNEGSPIMSNLDNSGSMVYTELVQQIIEKAKSVVRDLDPFNDLMVFRMRSKKYEIMVAPGKDFIMIVIENATYDVGS